MPRTICVATIQVALATDDPTEAMDGLSETLRELTIKYQAFLFDWQYVKHGGQYLYPTHKYVDDDYEEGEAFA